MAELRRGVMGISRVNQFVVAAINESPRHRAVAVAGRSVEKARAEAGRFSIPRAYGSFAELLGDREVEVVYIALPNALHAEWTIAAARAGKGLRRRSRCASFWPRRRSVASVWCGAASASR